jgi:hypothetical protein
MVRLAYEPLIDVRQPNLIVTGLQLAKGKLAIVTGLLLGNFLARL